jgi:hypothetical protein
MEQFSKQCTRNAWPGTLLAQDDVDSLLRFVRVCLRVNSDGGAAPECRINSTTQ